MTTSTQDQRPAKACTKCQQLVPLDQYHRDKRVPDGRRSECKLCFAAQKATRRPRPKPTPPEAFRDQFDTPELPGAACVGRWDLMDPPEPDEDPEHQALRLARAKALCDNCPALTVCQNWLNSLPLNKRPSGVVAGLIGEDNR